MTTWPTWSQLPATKGMPSGDPATCVAYMRGKVQCASGSDKIEQWSMGQRSPDLGFARLSAICLTSSGELLFPKAPVTMEEVDVAANWADPGHLHGMITICRAAHRELEEQAWLGAVLAFCVGNRSKQEDS